MTDERKRLGKLGAGLLFFLSIYVAVLAFAKVKEIRNGGQFTNVNTISVEGKGEVKALANIAQVYFSVNQTAKTAAEAQKKAAVISNQSLEYLRSVGVAEKDIKTENYTLYPKYEYREERIICVTFPCPQPPGKSVLVGYEASQSIRVKIKELDKTGEILEGLGKFAVSNLNGPNFSIEDKELLEAEARGKAIKDAKGKATKLAKELGVRLGKIVSFNEGGDFGYGGYVQTSERFSLDAVGKVIPELPKGAERIVSNVTITYQIK